MNLYLYFVFYLYLNFITIRLIIIITYIILYLNYILYFDKSPLKLNKIGEKEFTKEVAAYAIKMIGELRSIRKEFFEKILQ